MQCTNAGQVLARGGRPNTGTCTAQPAAQQALMKALPMVDSETGELEIQKMEGKYYVKV